MSSSQSIITDFVKSFAILLQTQSNVLTTYDLVKLTLDLRKENRLPISGSPLIKLQNQLIVLEYLINQHILNCKVYKKLIDEGIEIDVNFEAQIKGMININYQFSAEIDAFSKTVQPFTRVQEHDPA